jgi:superfamily II DNA or RNA helicase
MSTIQLRDYQAKAFDEIRVKFREAEQHPVLFVLPTGGGKTYTFSAIADSAARRGREVIIIVHRKELLTQASASLTNLGIEHGLISPFFTPNPHVLVQVASVDTLLIRLKKKPHKPKPGGLLVIFDEAHHVVDSNKWGRAFDALGRPHMLGVTATPVRTDGKGLGAHAGGVFKSMVLGPSVAELIERGMLVNPIVYTSYETPDFSDLKTNKDGDYNLQDLAAKVDKPKITGDAVDHYSRICPGAKAIVFCASIAHAKHVAEAFNAAGFKFELLVGAPEMSDAERTAVNRKLRRGEIDGACTVDLVSEGYDLPDLECCIMLRHTASEGLFLQQVGRIMRPSEAKRGCWLLDHVGNVGRLVDGEFKRKHGLPNEVREWSLDGRRKKKRKKDQDDEPTIAMKQCPKCFAVHAPATHCPACGYEYPAAARELEQVDGELVPLDQAAIAEQRKQQIRVQAASKTVEEMMANLGYTRGRAEAIVKAREEKDALRKTLEDALNTWRQETGIPPQELIGMFLADLKRLKPKELKAKHELVQRARTTFFNARKAGDDPVLALQLEKILNPADSPLL